jgi:hypothetical protein
LLRGLAASKLKGAKRAARAGTTRFAVPPAPPAPTAIPPAIRTDDRPENADPVPPSLTSSQTRVLVTMSRFDGSRLLATKAITDEMDAAFRLSDETVRLAVLYLIQVNLAERPEGERLGARLTQAGRKQAAKIGD